MARPTIGRRLHVAAFDEFLHIRGVTCALISKATLISESHISDLRAGRRSVTPPIAHALADALLLGSPDAILWPATAEPKTVAA